MKILMVLIVLCSFSLCAHSADEDAFKPGIDSKYWDEGDAREEGEQHSPRYERMERDLNREYEEGSLTKTEYIQRQREIEDLGEQ